MAVLDSFIKGYQDSQSRSDTLKDRALQLKQLQEEKARQAQQDAEERAKFGLQYVDQISKDPEWWKVNGDNQEVIGELLAKRNTFEQALNLPLTSALTDVRPSLYATTWAELQPKLASGEITDDAAYELMKAKVGEDVIGKQTMNLANSAVLQNGGKDDVLKLQLPEVAPLKLTKSVAPVFTLPKTGDKGIDDGLAQQFAERGEQGVRDFLKDVMNAEKLSSLASRSAGVGSALDVAGNISSAIINSPMLQAKAQLDNYDSEMAIHQRNIESDKAEQARWEAETDKRNYVLSKGHTTFAGTPGFKLMLATTYNKGEGDRKKAEFDKRVAGYDPSTVEGVKQKDWAEATAKGWTTLPFDEWKRSNAGEAMSAKNAVADYRQLESSLKILQSVAAKYGSTPEEQARFDADYGSQIYALKTKLASINKATDPMLDPLTGWIDIKTGSTEAQQLSAQATKERIDISKQNAQLSQDIFDERKTQTDIENGFKKIGLGYEAQRIELDKLRLIYSMQNKQTDDKINWSNYGGTNWVNALTKTMNSKKRGLDPAWKYGIVIDPVRNGTPRSMAIYTAALELSQFLQSKNLLGETNGQTYLNAEELRSAIDSDDEIGKTVDHLVAKINSLTANYKKTDPTFTYDRLRASEQSGESPTVMPAYAPSPAGMPTITPNVNGTATASVSGGKPIGQTKVGSDGVGRTERFAPIGPDYEVYQAKNKLWYQRSKYKGVKPKTGGSGDSSGSSKPSDFKTPIGTTKARNKNGKTVNIEIYN